jgi:hyperosmotically inducible protein
MAGSLLIGCQKRTSTVETPAGTATTTTITPSKSATEAMSRAGEAVGDAAITAKVKTALLADPDVKALRIDVDTKDGVVTLNGTADQQMAADKAVTIAKKIDGVKSVENKLTIKS